MSRIAVAIIVILCAPLSRDAASHMRESFDASIPAAPGHVEIEGTRWLLYELHLTNFSEEPLHLRKIDAFEGDRLLFSQDGPELAARLVLRSSSGLGGEIVGPGQGAILYVEFPLPSGPPPRTLRHRIDYTRAGGTQVEQTAMGAVTVQGAPKLALGPPLRGGPWAAIYGWHWPRGHRRVFYALDGRARLPGRFAIDWVLLDERGLQAHGDVDLVANSFGYGADVLAVASGRVAEVRDGVEESQRISTNPDHPLEDAAGNFVVLELGDGRFAVYEHLKPNSIRVSRGQRVHRGEVLASLGFTGDSTGPHLHFHVADGPSPLLGEGVPFVFEKFTRLGHFEDMAHFGSSRWLESGSTQPHIRKRERPAPNAVVLFD
ncbi:MAG TPA: M23 family metallopeptidase [Terriglobia bacterium]|nr:M23 family metallopeptidase [Terriglobia bacterium]